MKSLERISIAVALSVSLLSTCPASVWAASIEAETGSDETESEETAGWEIAPSVDEFGDVKDESDGIRYPIDGTFKNSATSGSELTGYIFYQPDTTFLDTGVFSVRLLEYGDTHASYLDSDVYEGDGIIMKTKDDDGNVQEYRLVGKAPDSDLVLFAHSGPFATSKDLLNTNARAANLDLAKSLKDGKDLKTVIYIGSSKYSFTVLLYFLKSIINFAIVNLTEYETE